MSHCMFLGKINSYFSLFQLASIISKNTNEYHNAGTYMRINVHVHVAVEIHSHLYAAYFYQPWYHVELHDGHPSTRDCNNPLIFLCNRHSSSVCNTGPVSLQLHLYTCMYVYMSSGGYLHIFPKLYCYMYMYVITFKELHIIYYIDMSCTLYICTCMQGKALLYLRVNYAVHALYIHTPVPGQLCGYQLNNLPSGILIHM